MKSPASRRLLEKLFAPTDIASLVIFRICFGALMLWEVWRHLDGDWIERNLLEPKFHFTYFGFDWVKVWPNGGIYYHFYALGLLSAAILLGFCYRFSVLLFFLGFTYVFLLEQSLYLNHYYLICLISFLMLFVPAHRDLSVDAWLRRGWRSETVPAWPLWLLRAQMGLVYFYAGVAKLNRDWLEGWPLRMWLPERNDLPLIGSLLEQGWVAVAFSQIGLTLDLLAAPLLLWKRTRLSVFLLLLCFHLLNAQLFRIGVFPWFSIAMTLLFFSADWPRRIFNWPRTSALELRPAGDPGGSWRARSSWCAAALLTVYLPVQMLLPLRHFLYPGNVSWTEEGHRFAWHMKLRDKDADATFLVTDPDSGTVWTVDPLEELTSRQYRKMASRPYMIQQYARHLAERAKADGWNRVEVRADVQASLNGRARLPLIDKTVDLAAQPRGLLPKPWILPLEQDVTSRPRSAESSERDDP